MKIRPVQPDKLTKSQRAIYDQLWPGILKSTYIPLDFPPPDFPTNVSPGYKYVGNELQTLKAACDKTRAIRQELGEAIGFSAGELLVWASILKEPERTVTANPVCLHAIMRGHAIQRMENKRRVGATLLDMCLGDYDLVDALSHVLAPLTVIGVQPTSEEIGYISDNNTCRVAEDNSYWISDAAFLWAAHHYYRAPERREELYREELFMPPPTEVMTTELNLV